MSERTKSSALIIMLIVVIAALGGYALWRERAREERIVTTTTTAITTATTTTTLPAQIVTVTTSFVSTKTLIETTTIGNVTKTTTVLVPTTVTTTLTTTTLRVSTTTMTSTITSRITTTITTTTTTTTTVTTREVVRELNLGGVVKEISYGNIEKATNASMMSEIDSLSNLGIKVFSIHLNYDPFLRKDQQKIALIDKAISTIKARGKILVIVDASAESYWGTEIPWAKWKELHRARVTDIATRYKPDYYVLVKEPRWYEDGGGGKGMISHTDTSFRGRENEEWAKFIPELASAVKAVNPTTKTVVALVPPEKADQELLPLIAKIAELDVIGFDSYGGGGLISPIGDPKNLNMLTELIPKVGGKEVMLTETWIALVMRTGGDIDAEAKWVHTAAEFAYTHNIKITIYFYLADRINEPKIVDAVKSVVQQYQT